MGLQLQPRHADALDHRSHRLLRREQPAERAPRQPRPAQLTPSCRASPLRPQRTSPGAELKHLYGLRCDHRADHADVQLRQPDGSLHLQA